LLSSWILVDFNFRLDDFAQLTYKGTVFENGTLTDLGINDPLRAVFEQLDRLLARAATGKKIPVRTLLDILD